MSVYGPRNSRQSPLTLHLTCAVASAGAWFDVVFETYDCTPGALDSLKSDGAR